MPELPEVQTIITDLNQKIKGDTIVGFWSDWGKVIKNKSVEEFTKEIKNRKILGARRIGKNIFLDLSDGKTLYLHLKMTGHLLVKFSIFNFQFSNKSKIKISKPKTHDYFSEKVNQYIHHIFYLKNQKSNLKIATQNSKLDVKYNKTLEFSDLRKFGKIVLLDTKEVESYKDIKSLGVDAMSPKFTFKKLEEILNKKSKTPIGIALMDQNLISGIGNIYRSEILFSSGVLPMRRISDINPEERKKIYHGIKKVLKKAINLRGTSDSDYRDTAGAPGNFQKVLFVYRRAGQKCRLCDTIIKRIKLGQRSAFYCPKCQK